MNHNYTGLASYENEGKVNDIEHNIRYTLLSNSDEERRNESFCITYKYYFICIIGLLLLIVFIWLDKIYHLF
jgi:hypothetical protein